MLGSIAARTRRALGATAVALAALSSACAVITTTPAAANERTPPPRQESPIIDRSRLRPEAQEQARRGHFPHERRVGTVQPWPALATNGSASDGTYYLKDHTLRGVSEHLEIWVASGTDPVSTGLGFPAGDCRNGPMTTVTDAQVQYLLDEFEAEIRPTIALFLPPPVSRDGKSAQLPRWEPAIPSSAFRGPGDRVVVLVDNFREPMFFDAASRSKGTLGFTDPFLTVMTGRNVIALRGTSWAWGLGDDPEASVWSADPCARRIGDRNGVERTLAHEYAHVIQGGIGTSFDTIVNDPGWLTEGTAEWAAAQTGYAPASGGGVHSIDGLTGAASLSDDPIAFLPDGPETSLTISGERTPANDYAAPFSFLDLLATRYGTGVITDLVTRTDVYGMDKLEAVVADHGGDAGFGALVSDWSTMLSLDAVLDDGATLVGDAGDGLQADSLRAELAWTSPYAGDRPGLLPNSSDFIRLDADDLQSLDFDGDERLDCRWTVDPNGRAAGNGALHSGGFLNGQNRAAAVAVDVPAGTSTIELDLRYDLEPGYDYAYLQVSEDGGATWRSLPATGNTTDHAPDALPSIVADLPGFTGTSEEWTHVEASLPVEQARTVLIGIRQRTDRFLAGAGVWVDDLVVNGDLVGDGASLDGWQDFSPLVDGATVRIVSYDDEHTVAAVTDLALDDARDGHLDAAALAAAVAPGADVVGVIVTHQQTDPFSPCLWRYRLRVNGELQPGG